MKDCNELFELAKDLHSEAKSDKDVKSLELIERLFPQLKETEEEKTLADLKKLVCARADSRDIERFIKFLSRVTPVFTDKEESFCEHILPRIVSNPFEWTSEQRSADLKYLKEFIDGIKGRFVAKHAEEDNDNEVSETNDKILGTMLSHFKAKTKSDWCGLPVRDIIAWLEKQKEPLPIPDKFSGLKSLMLQYLQSASNRKDDSEIESDTDLWGRKILDYVWKHDEKQKEQKPNIVEKLREISTPAKEDWFEIEKKWETEDNEDLRSFISVKFASNAKVIDGKRFAVFTWERFKDVALDFVNRGKEQKPAEMDNEEIELSDFESELFSAFSDGWQQYLLGEEVDVAQWAKEHSAQILNAAQQELKPAEWSDSDKLKLRQTLECLEYLSCQGKAECVSWLKELPERFNLHPKQEWNEEEKGILLECISVLQNSSHWLLADKLSSLRPQEKQEWSEEDETHLIHTIHLIEEVSEWAKKDGLHRRCVASCDEILPWLKSFRSKPKQESEPMEIKYAGKIYKVYGTKEFPGGIVGYKIEDEPGDFNYIINPDEVLGGYDIKSNGSFYPAKEANFSQPHWKPSEEQMEALWNLMHYAVTLCFWPELEKSIESLYKDLKKL